jgi:NADP-dependent 3-hydroxy acid dehydrogenase YdfG
VNSQLPPDDRPKSAKLILVTAATAPVGRAIVEQLVAAGRPAASEAVVKIVRSKLNFSQILKFV